MIVVDLYNGIFKILANDPTILSLLDIDTTIDVDALKVAKAEKIQKRRKPQNLISNIPLIAFYSPGGNVERNNDLVYCATFVFDVYTNDDIEKAHEIHNRISKIFDDCVPSIPTLTTFLTHFEEAYESETDLANTYCFTTICTFSVGLED